MTISDDFKVRAGGVVLLLVGVLGSLVGATASPLAAVAADTPPNVVLIMTDDMNDDDLHWMPLTRRLIADKGTKVTDFLSPHPLCCPARAMVLTGQYAQNNGVHHNAGPFDQRNLRRAGNNVGRWAQHAGYRTALVGKFLNDFGRKMETSLSGWNRFDVTMDCVFCARGATYWDDGRVTTSSRYTTSYVRDETVADIERFSAAGRPFLVWTNPVAPHEMRPGPEQPIEPPIPAPRDLGTMSDVPLPSGQKPSFDVAGDVYPGQTVTRKFERHFFQRRIESLQAVDRMVRDVVRALAALGELDDTVIIFTADNGFVLGEHALHGKNFAYEEDLQVPFLIRGPGIPEGRSVDATLNLVDVASTIAELTGSTSERTQDGRSMIPVITGDEGGDVDTLIQAGAKRSEWWWRGVRDRRWTYVEHRDGARELYDRANDPFQLYNLAGTGADDEVRLAARLEELRDCSGVACYTRTPP